MPETPDEWKGLLLFAIIAALYFWAFGLPLIRRLQRWARRMLRQHWARPGGAAAGRWPKVLVADDEPFLLRSFRDDLEDAGYRVVTSIHSHGVPEAARSEEPDLILLDVYMPPDAHSACAAIQLLISDPRTADIPIILMKARQAYPEPGCQRPICCHRPEAVSSYPLLEKPFHRTQLLALIARLLQDGSSERQGGASGEQPK